MTGRQGNRQRIKDAYNLKFTGEVPFYETYVAREIVEEVMGREMGTHMINLPPKDYVEFLRRTGMDAGYLYSGWFLARKTKTDDHGRVHYIDGMIKSRDNFNLIEPPSLDIAKCRIEDFLQAAQNTGIGTTYALDKAHNLGFTAIGPEDFCLALHQDPDFVNEFFDRVEEYILPLAEMAAQYPLDAIWLTGPFCSKNGPMISPEMQAEFILPRIEKVVSILKPSGIPLVLHVDGDSSTFMDWIIETGFAAIHPVEPGIDNFNIHEIKARYGDQICLHGNIDVGTILANGTCDEVRADTLEHIRKLAPGGGYICGSSHDISENIPFENFEAMVKTICSTTITKDGRIETLK